MTNEKATAKHTPGPWEAIQTSSNRCTTEVNREYSTRFIIIPADGPVLARVYCDDDRNPAAANARLIAAAPELLEALKRVLTADMSAKSGETDEHSMTMQDALDWAQAAIQKAEAS